MAAFPLAPQRRAGGAHMPQLTSPSAMALCRSTGPCGVGGRNVLPCNRGSRVEASSNKRPAQVRSARARKGQARRALAARAQREPALEAQLCRESPGEARAGREAGAASPLEVDARPDADTSSDPSRSSPGTGVVVRGLGQEARDSRGILHGFLEEAIPRVSPESEAWAPELPASGAASPAEGEGCRESGGGATEGEGNGEMGNGSMAVRTSPLRVLLIDNYDSYTYNLYHLIAVCNSGVPPVVIRNDDLAWDTLRPLLVGPCFPGGKRQVPSSADGAGSALDEREAGARPRPSSDHLFDCVVISPGPGSPAIASDIGVCLDVLQHCTHLPVLGVCMGHQALGVASGARVGLAPQPVHGLLSPVSHSGHRLFQGIPSGKAFQVVRYHSLVVDAASLPLHLEAIGWTAHHGEAPEDAEGGKGGPSSASAAPAPNGVGPEAQEQSLGGGVEGRSEGDSESIIMALAHKELPHWGVQFHPESIETRYGAQLLSNFLDLAAEFWKQRRPPTGVPAAAPAQAQARSAAVEFGPHRLNLPLEAATQLDALLAASARSSPHQALRLGSAPSAGTPQTPQAPVDGIQGPNQGCTQREPMDASEGEALPGTAPSGQPHATGHGSAQETASWEASRSGDSQPPAGRQLALHWERVPGALQGVPGGSAWLFQMLFGTSEAEAEDTFWLDSSTAEQGATAAPQEQPAADLAPQDCSWSSSSGSSGRSTTSSSSSSTSTRGNDSSSGRSEEGAVGRTREGDGASSSTSERWDRGPGGASVPAARGMSGSEDPLAGPVQPRPRFSFMGGVGGRLWRKVVYHLSVSGGELQVMDRRGEATTSGASGAEGGIFEHLEQVLEEMQLPAGAGAELPFDFCGGFVGYLGYELKAESGAQRSRHQSEHPDAFFFLVDRFLAVDHSTGDLYVLGLGGDGESGDSDGGHAAGRSLGKILGSRAGVEPNGMQAHIVPVPRGEGSSVGHRRREGEAAGSRPLWERLGSIGATGEWVKALAEELRAEIVRATPVAVRPLQGARSELRPWQMGQGLGRELSSAGTDPSASELESRKAQGEEGVLHTQNGAARGTPGGSAHLSPRIGQQEYEEAVRECQRHILVGESYELCLTTQLEGGAGAEQRAPQGCARPQDALEFYLTLRSVSPAPYGAWLSGQYRSPRHALPNAAHAQGQGLGQGEMEEGESVVLCCSSPERFLRLDASGVLEAKPIKGTRPRGATPQEDRALAEALRTNVKDRAENLMIVDLLRNDLGRVSALGSVGVPSLMAVESYAFVHQLVSTVRSRLHPSVSPVAAVRAAFPGGSMTGAPKIRSMQLLDEIEGCARGPYSGVLGYFSLSQTFSFNIVIRSAVLSKDTISVGAGGAVIALSNPTAEFREMRLKARSVEKALALLQPGGLGSTLPGRASLMERSAVGPERS